MLEDENRQEVIDEALLMMASKRNPTYVEIAERIKRRYYI